MSTLQDFYSSHNGKVSDRWWVYLQQYDRLLSNLRTERIRLLEIGIQNGGSLELWSRYFPAAKLIVGCDVNPLCAELIYEDPRIAVVVADACTDEGQRRIEKLSTSFDVVIDDGSHRSSH